MATPDLTPVPDHVLPTEVHLSRDDLASPRFTPRELRLIKDTTGHSFTTLIGDDDSDDKVVVIAWLKLRRDGYDVTLADMDDVVLSFNVDAEDPTNASPPTTSPRSATGGG